MPRIDRRSLLTGMAGAAAAAGVAPPPCAPGPAPRVTRTSR